VGDGYPIVEMRSAHLVIDVIDADDTLKILGLL
jgi:hypothetical protein